MERIKIQMLDPTFMAGEVKTASATLQVKPSGLSCTAELWLSKDGVSKDATSGLVAFTATGVDQSISLSVTMPVGGFEYTVLLDILTEGTLIGAYTAMETVLVPWVGEPVITW